MLAKKPRFSDKKTFHQMFYCASYGFSRQVEGSFDKPKAQNVLAKGLEVFWKKKQFPSKLHLFSKGFFNQALGGFDNNALNFSLNSWESFAQNPKKFKISESFKKGIVPQIVSPGTCKPFLARPWDFSA